jgi:hypothetical protein
MLAYALHYASRGWSIVPVAAGTKDRPCVKWKPFQTKPADELQVKKWFANGSHNMAVVFGAVSGGLACRDFDTMEAYQAWAASHPDFAEVLPTVATSRGRHVYFSTTSENLRFVDLRTIDPPEDGEYRGDSGHYCLLPPSIHPDGPIYKWVVPLPDGDIPFVADVRAAGLLPAYVTEETDEAQETSCPVSSVSSVSSVTSEGTDPEIERAILATIPAHTGRRNRQVFELARALKGIPRLADAPADAMRPYVRRWHRVGLERGVIATVPFEETLIDFIHAWPRVKFPKGNQRVLAIVQRAKDSPPPAVAQNYEGDRLRLLVAICREFQRESGSSPFFLSCRMAAALLGLGENGHVSAWRWLELLVHDKVLENVERGERGKRRATRYRYIGDRNTSPRIGNLDDSTPSAANK